MRLDKKWTEHNIERLFPKSNVAMWTAAFAGYLNNPTLYTELYKLLKSRGDYAIAIKTDFGDESTNDRLVQSVTLAYMLGLEDFEETSLMRRLISREDNGQLGEVIHYISSLEENEHIGDKGNKARILWRALFEILAAHANDANYQQLIIHIGKWLGLIDEIDEEVEKWITFTIDHTNEVWELPFLVEHLLIHVENAPQRVADIYIYLLSKEKYPDFPEEKVVELVARIFEKEEIQKGTIICNKYLNANFTFLIPVFEKYER